MSAAFRLALQGLLDQKGLLGPKAHKDPLVPPVLKVQQDPRAQRDHKDRKEHKDRRGRKGLKARRDPRDRQELEWLSRFPRTPLLAIRRSFRTWEYSTPLPASRRSLATRMETTTRLLAPRRCETIPSASLTTLSAR